jgi:low affinity Fe/Cu permease
MQRPITGRVPAEVREERKILKYVRAGDAYSSGESEFRQAFSCGFKNGSLFMAQNKKTRRRKNGSNSNDSSFGKKVQEGFGIFAQAISRITGRPATFLLALLVVIIWAVTGPLFGFSDTWQLVINTGTTIVTFLMVFLIQNTQNRDTLAIQLKLSELILAMEGVPNKYAMIEDLTDDELEALHDKCRGKAEEALEHLTRRKKTKATS